MITKDQITQLSSDEKDQLILNQAAQIIKLEARITALEDLLKNKKTSKNSSTPPSRDQKENLPDKKKKHREKSFKRPGHARDLHPNPYKIMELKIKNCQECGDAFGEDDQNLHVEYDKIEIPPIEPITTRVRLYQCTCKKCGATSKASAPCGFEEGSPFGASIEGLIAYMRYGHFVGYKRLSEMFLHVFGLSISQGAIANIFKRLNDKLDPHVQSIIDRIRSARLVCSDETSARVNGKNEWEWVFQNAQVALHVIRPSRGAKVVQEIMGDHRPTYWISDLYGAQKGHAEKWQICLAHQLRDCQGGVDSGDHSFSWRMKRLFMRSIVLSKRRPHVKPTTCLGYRRQLEKDLDVILSIKPMTKMGERLRRRYMKNRDSLFMFFEDQSIEPTNNSSERELRPSVIFRKVTNGFRSDWGKEFFANMRSIIGTGARQGLNPYQAIQKSLTPNTPFLNPSAQ